MNCVSIIRKTGNSENGDHLMGKFDKTTAPDSVTVKGTSDTENVNGNSGVWVSGDKYMDTGVTLVLHKAGQADKECCYSPTSGANIICKPDVRISDYNISVDASGNVTLTWKSVAETGLTVWFIFKKTGSGEFEFFDSRDKKTAGTAYSVNDVLAVGSGSYSYQLRAILDDGNETDFDEKPVTI